MKYSKNTKIILNESNYSKFMIKVAHFITPGGFYGAERWILDLMSHLDRSSNILLTLSTSNKEILVEAKKLKIRNKSIKVKNNYAIFRSAKKLSDFIKKEKIGIIHTHGYKSDIIGIIAAKMAGITAVSTPHGWSTNSGLKLKVYEFLDQIILGFFDKVTPLSAGLKKSLIFVSKKKITVIKNFVNLKRIPKQKKGNAHLITYIGQLIESKRVNDLIISLKYLSQDIKLQIIGDGPKRKELEKLTKKLNLAKRIKFCGFRNDVLDLLNKSGVFILPSLSEGIPRAMMEAMALEKLVIGTNIQGIRELIKHKETGLLVPKKSPEKIAEAIRWALNNKNKAEKIAKNGKRLIEEEFSAEMAAKKYEKVYKDLLKK